MLIRHLAFLGILSLLFFGIRTQNLNATNNTLRNNTLNATNITAINPTNTNLTEIVVPSLYLENKYINSTLAKVVPSYIPEVNTVNSTCFNNLKNFIGYLSDYEQAVLVNAANLNKDSNRCFNCTILQQNLVKGFNNQLAQIASIITQRQIANRDPLSCLLSFGPMQGLDNGVSQNITNNIIAYIYYQKINSICMSNFLRVVGEVMLGRRRFLCANLNVMIKWQ